MSPKGRRIQAGANRAVATGGPAPPRGARALKPRRPVASLPAGFEHDPEADHVVAVRVRTFDAGGRPDGHRPVQKRPAANDVPLRLLARPRRVLPGRLPVVVGLVPVAAKLPDVA